MDSIPKNLETTITICYTDDYAYNINLYQASGIAGLKGLFEFRPSEGMPNNKNLGANFDSSTGVLNANAAFDGENNSSDTETYVFVYRPASGECINGDMKIKVIVTKYIN